jgi:hypothetical protein
MAVPAARRLRLLIDAPGEEAAVDDEHLAVDEAGGFREAIRLWRPRFAQRSSSESHRGDF